MSFCKHNKTEVNCCICSGHRYQAPVVETSSKKENTTNIEKTKPDQKQRQPVHAIVTFYAVAYMFLLLIMFKDNLDPFSNGLFFGHLTGLFAYLIIFIEIFSRIKIKQPVFKKFFAFNLLKL